MKRKKINAEKARKISIISYLKRQGIDYVRQSGQNFFFLSPFRSEADPSFKVNAEKNIWFDFGAGIGGSIIDLVMKMNNIGFSDALKVLSGCADISSFSFHRPKNQEGRIQINHIQDLQNKALIQYLQQRKISCQTAFPYVKEAYFKVSGTQYFALAFENDKGGFELRNKFWQGGNSPKYYRTVNGRNANALNIFEGFMDFFSALEYFGVKQSVNDTVILNSNSNLKHLIPILPKYKVVYAYLDNDTSGKNAFLDIRKHARQVKYAAQILYPNHKDFNDYLCGK